MSESNWKEALGDQIPEEHARELEIFAGQLELRKQNKLDEKVFAETRLRWGIYGQRYDNGQRFDGEKTQTLRYPSADLTKGPNTLWDAPGMQRIKIPFGGMNPAQMEVLAEIADEYSDGILHVTTRQDIQMHYIHIDDTPDLMRRLAAVGITTHEACGNVVRNVTGCPLAGICHDEAFDATPYAKAMAFFLLGHDDTQDFGRKFKIAFSGCEQHACALVNIHDMGLLAQTRVIDGEVKRGFTVFVGGGLGTIPHQAKLLSEFVPEEEILPLAQSMARVFARLGEKKNRNRARLKFLVEQLGIDEFRRLVYEEREILTPDPRWTEYLKDVPDYKDTPARIPVSLNGTPRPDGFEAWYATNVYHQRQPNYSAVYVNLPLGDITAPQMFQLADIARKYAGDSVRTTVEQNMVLRWVSEADLPDLYRELKVLGLAEPGIDTIVDITSCPGTDTCKLGIASSRGLAGELRQQLAAQAADFAGGGQGTQNQGERLLQFLRSAPHRGHWFLRQQPPIRELSGAALPTGAGRHVEAKRRQLRGRGGRGALQAGAGGAGSHHYPLRQRARRRARTSRIGSRGWARRKSATCWSRTRWFRLMKAIRPSTPTGTIPANTRWVTSAWASARARWCRCSRWRSPKPNRLTLMGCWRWTRATAPKPTPTLICRCCWRRGRWCAPATST